MEKSRWADDQVAKRLSSYMRPKVRRWLAKSAVAGLATYFGFRGLKMPEYICSRRPVGLPIPLRRGTASEEYLRARLAV